jgi:hypothetical protein
MRALILFSSLLLLFITASTGVADGGEQSPQVVFYDYNLIPGIAPLPRTGDVRKYHVEVGEWGEHFVLLMPEFVGAKWHKLQAEQRNHRCPTVSSEGPHLDFLNWKRQTSSWKKMEKHMGWKWKNATFTEDDFPPLPHISPGELGQKVAEQLGEFPDELRLWKPYVSRCEKNMASCYGECESEIRFFMPNTSGEPKTVLTVRLMIPMGC